MRVGNDVVDLRDPANQPASLHPRFDERVFTDGERALLRTARTGEEGHRLRWTLWALKEAALKARRQTRPDLPFRPAEFEVVPGPGAAAPRVRTGDAWLTAVVDESPERVHAIVSDLPLHVDSPDVLLVLERRADASEEARGAAFVRRRCAEFLADRLRVPSDRVRVSGPGDGARSGAPTASANGRALPAAISFSHDGAWDAAVVISPAAFA